MDAIEDRDPLGVTRRHPGVLTVGRRHNVVREKRRCQRPNEPWAARTGASRTATVRAVDPRAVQIVSPSGLIVTWRAGPGTRSRATTVPAHDVDGDELVARGVGDVGEPPARRGVAGSAVRPHDAPHAERVGVDQRQAAEGRMGDDRDRPGGLDAARARVGRDPGDESSRCRIDHYDVRLEVGGDEARIRSAADARSASVNENGAAAAARRNVPPVHAGDTPVAASEVHGPRRSPWHVSPAWTSLPGSVVVWAGDACATGRARPRARRAGRVGLGSRGALPPHWPRAYRAAYLVVHDAAAAEDIAAGGVLSRPCARSTASTAGGRSARGSTGSSSTARSTGRARARFASRGGARRAPAGARAGRARAATLVRRARRPRAGAPRGDRAALPARVHARRDRRRARAPRGTVNSRLRRGLDALGEETVREGAREDRDPGRARGAASARGRSSRRRSPRESTCRDGPACHASPPSPWRLRRRARRRSAHRVWRCSTRSGTSSAWSERNPRSSRFPRPVGCW